LHSLCFRVILLSYFKVASTVIPHSFTDSALTKIDHEPCLDAEAVFFVDESRITYLRVPFDPFGLAFDHDAAFYLHPIHLLS
jgi:hypothetical protein